MAWQWLVSVSHRWAELCCARYLLGWKAMPFAREDLDSNCSSLSARLPAGCHEAGDPVQAHKPWSTCRVRTAFWRGDEAAASCVREEGVADQSWSKMGRQGEAGNWRGCCGVRELASRQHQKGGRGEATPSRGQVVLCWPGSTPGCYGAIEPSCPVHVEMWALAPWLQPPQHCSADATAATVPAPHRPGRRNVWLAPPILSAVSVPLDVMLR